LHVAGLSESMAGMNRRQFALVSIASSAALLAGCDDEPKPDPLATLLNSPAVQSAFSDLQDASDNLESHVGDFDDDNWRDVVDDVRTDSTDVSDAVEALKQALGYSG